MLTVDEAYLDHGCGDSCELGGRECGQKWHTLQYIQVNVCCCTRELNRAMVCLAVDCKEDAGLTRDHISSARRIIYKRDFAKEITGAHCPQDADNVMTHSF